MLPTSINVASFFLILGFFTNTFAVDIAAILKSPSPVFVGAFASAIAICPAVAVILFAINVQVVSLFFTTIFMIRIVLFCFFDELDMVCLAIYNHL